MLLVPISSVAAAAGLSTDYIREFDDVLKPLRGAGGRRLYDVRTVEEFVRARRAKANAR